MTKEQVEKASEVFFKSFDEASALNKDSVDAVVKAGEVLTKGAETFGELTMKSRKPLLKPASKLRRR